MAQQCFIYYSIDLELHFIVSVKQTVMSNLMCEAYRFYWLQFLNSKDNCFPKFVNYICKYIIENIFHRKAYMMLCVIEWKKSLSNLFVS